MSDYSATYYFNGTEAPARLQLQKNNLCIEVWSAEKPLQVIWHYPQIQVDENATNRFTYGSYPQQSLHVLHPSLAEDLHTRITTRKKGVFLTPVAKVILAAILFLIAIYLFVVPWLAGSLANRIPVSYEKQLGDQLYQSLKGGFTIDDEKTFIINEFYNELHIPSPYNIKITVVESNMANAFAMPGGHIVVYSKIINEMQSYEELAALLAHEFTHVQQRHTLRSLFRQLGSSVFFLLLLGDAGAASAAILSNADNLRSLSYSRSLENEADEAGAQLMIERGIDCAGFEKLFYLLKKESGSTEPAEWVSSHPNLNNRIQNIKQNTACQQATPRHNNTLMALFLKLKQAK